MAMGSSKQDVRRLHHQVADLRAELAVSERLRIAMQSSITQTGEP